MQSKTELVIHFGFFEKNKPRGIWFLITHKIDEMILKSY